MRLKLDENLGKSLADVLRQAGHEVATVPDQGLFGTEDRTLRDMPGNPGYGVRESSPVQAVRLHRHRGVAVANQAHRAGFGRCRANTYWRTGARERHGQALGCPAWQDS